MGKMKLPHSYDVIGDILILNEESTLEQAKSLLKILKNVKTVLKEKGIHQGKYRTQKLTFLAGIEKKETIHRESGCSFKLDIEKCYFSPRLSNERLRIVKLVKPNEDILVMFSGVGIYPIILSKHTKAKEIYGIEINPTAHKYAEENLKLNKISNVKLFKGDVKAILPKIKKKFDRIIMPHPTDSESYLKLAFKKLKNHGVIHLYLFSKEEDFENLKQKYKKFKPKLVKCGIYSPYTYRICLDLKL